MRENVKRRRRSLTDFSRGIQSLGYIWCANRMNVKNLRWTYKDKTMAKVNMCIKERINGTERPICDRIRMRSPQPHWSTVQKLTQNQQLEQVEASRLQLLGNFTLTRES